MRFPSPAKKHHHEKTSEPQNLLNAQEFFQ